MLNIEEKESSPKELFMAHMCKLLPKSHNLNGRKCICNQALCGKNSTFLQLIVDHFQKTITMLKFAKNL